jgi:16S rRNA (cytosine967-C5)-methyltransferase
MNARAAAIKILGRVRATDAYLNVVLDAQLEEERFEDPRDAALVTELCYGTTRRQLGIDFALSQFSDRSLEKLEDRVLAALRIGAYQIFFMRVPDRAAVSETVSGLRQLGLERAAGFVNAVLRNLAALPDLPSPAPTDRTRFLSIHESHPEWLVTRWLGRYGPSKAEEMLSADNSPPPVVVRSNSSKVTREQLCRDLSEIGIRASPGRIAPQAVVLESPGRLGDLYGYREGLWQVQDEAAQAVIAYASIPDHSRVMDVCAAPGGKACALAERNNVLAIDLHPNKLRKIENEAKRLGLNERIQVLAHDATLRLPTGSSRWDAVLIDAPCSGLGTLNRHPELRYRRREEDFPRLVELQRRILNNVAESIPEGGILIYAVCSTEPEEGEEQIAHFLRKHPSFALTPANPAQALEPYVVSGCLRTLPGSERMDGFFAARLSRIRP